MSAATPSSSSGPELDAEWPAPAGARLALERAERAHLAAVRAHVAAGCHAAGVAEAGRDALTLAADEVCANVVTHAYGHAPGPLTVDVAPAARGGCAVTIVDAGPPFDPTALPAPTLDAPLDERPVGGLGWHLVRSSVHALHYARVAAHNVVVLEWRAGGPEGAPPAARS